MLHFPYPDLHCVPALSSVYILNVSVQYKKSKDKLISATALISCETNRSIEPNLHRLI